MFTNMYFLFKDTSVLNADTLSHLFSLWASGPMASCQPDRPTQLSPLIRSPKCCFRISAISDLCYLWYDLCIFRREREPSGQKHTIVQQNSGIERYCWVNTFDSLNIKFYFLFLSRVSGKNIFFVECWKSAWATVSCIEEKVSHWGGVSPHTLRGSLITRLTFSF